MKELIEQQIRELLKLDIRATTLSNILFGQFGGLFGQLASTEQERKLVSQSPLFQEAQARIRELGQRDSAELTREVEMVNAALAKAKAAVDSGSATNGAPVTPASSAPAATS